jgi:hypothetical protein
MMYVRETRKRAKWGRGSRGEERGARREERGEGAHLELGPVFGRSLTL